MTSIHIDTLKLSSDLYSKLEQIAAKGNGKVSLHGRLFAQWLHFVFPTECPYPHAAGTVRPRTQGERLAQGESNFIEEEDRAKHLQQRVVQNREVGSDSQAMEDDLWSW